MTQIKTNKDKQGLFEITGDLNSKAYKYVEFKST